MASNTCTLQYGPGVPHLFIFTQRFKKQGHWDTITAPVCKYIYIYLFKMRPSQLNIFSSIWCFQSVQWPSSPKWQLEWERKGVTAVSTQSSVCSFLLVFAVFYFTERWEPFDCPLLPAKMWPSLHAWFNARFWDLDFQNYYLKLELKWSNSSQCVPCIKSVILAVCLDPLVIW